MFRIKTFFILVSFIFSFLVGAKEFCRLQPSSFDGEKESIREFEENIEEALSKIYQTEYPLLSEKFIKRSELVQQMVQIEDEFYEKYASMVSKKGSRDRSSFSSRKKVLAQGIEKGIQTKEEWEIFLQESSFVLSVIFEEFQKDLKGVMDKREVLQRLNDEISPLKAPYFLYPPKVSYSFRGGEVSYGDLQMEAFFRPPVEDLFKLPFLNIGFEMNQNTVIYTCLHFDSFDSDKNKLYIYFLNTTKFYELSWIDLFTDFNLVVRSVLSSGRPPEALVAPIPFVVNPAQNVSNFISKANSVTSQINSLKSVTSVMNQLDFLDFTAQINPVLRIILSNVDFGIKGVLVEPNRAQLSYAGSSLFGLINFNLGKYDQNADFSSFMNIFTWEEEDEAESRIEK